MSTRRALRAVALGVVVVGILLVCPLASAGPGDAAPAGSVVTKSGTGAFADLTVTVSQTTNLINQTITVSWTGGHPTVPGNGTFGVNYLQIMQCWGDDPVGPDRTQCQYGGSSTQISPAAGNFVRSRQVSADVVDLQEKLTRPAGSFDNAFVPFWAVGRPRPQPTDSATANENAFVDSQVTNEVPLGITRGDGTGLEFFEVETVRQAAGLGCGEPVTTGGVTTGRSCWLVIVPRGNTEVDGSPRSGNGQSRLDSSPLSQTNWNNRIVVALGFQPVGQACPVGAPERRVIGHELAADAVTSWQPALCAGGGALFSYSQLTDEVTRRQVLDGSTPGLGLLTNPIPPDQVPADHPLVYAPVGLSGLAIAFTIERQPRPTAPAADLALSGQRFTSMNLTPRLVAKLLTQSYQGAVQVRPDVLKNNPIGLTVDQEFLKINPEYNRFAESNIPPDALVQLDSSDVTSLLWSWVVADQDARAFLAGTPDKDGMVVNPANRGLTLPTSTFPRNDQSCTDVVDAATSVTFKICTSDVHPFTKDMHDSGRSAGRGDTQARTTAVEPNTKAPISKKVDRQNPGQRALLAVVDAATATRYGLPTATLRNAAGKFVAPTTASLLAGAAAMKPSAVPSVLVSDPGATDPAAYPLTALSYAVTAPSTLDAPAGRDYAVLLRYAAGAGQRPGIAPGQLPLGMVPLPDALTAQTIAAAATIEAQAGKATRVPPEPQPTSARPGPAGSPGGPSTPPSPTAAATGPSATAPGASTSPVAPTAPSAAQQPVAEVRRTPSLPGPAWLSTMLVIILIGCVLAVMSPPVRYLLRTSPPVRYLVGAVAHRCMRKGVTPTER
ncbi:MAG: hypothetical protein ACRDQY_24580 [Pseudonocardiaceae bacterium]